MPDFTRKHYERIAGSIDAVVARGTYMYGPRITQAEAIALRLADVFAADNPNFDRMRFLEACGFPEAYKEHDADHNPRESDSDMDSRHPDNSGKE